MYVQNGEIFQQPVIIRVIRLACGIVLCRTPMPGRYHPRPWVAMVRSKGVFEASHDDDFHFISAVLYVFSQFQFMGWVMHMPNRLPIQLHDGRRPFPRM